MDRDRTRSASDSRLARPTRDMSRTAKATIAAALRLRAVRRRADRRPLARAVHAALLGARRYGCGSRRASCSPMRALTESACSSRCRGSCRADGRGDRGASASWSRTGVAAAALLAPLIYGLLAIGCGCFCRRFSTSRGERRAVSARCWSSRIAGCVAQPLRVFGAVLAGLQDVRFNGLVNLTNWLLGFTLTVLCCRDTACTRSRLRRGADVRERRVEPLARGDDRRRDLLRGWPRPRWQDIRRLYVEGPRHVDRRLGLAHDRASDGLVLAALGARPRSRRSRARTSSRSRSCSSRGFRATTASSGLAHLAGETAGSATPRRDRRHGARLSCAGRSGRLRRARRQPVVRPPVGRTRSIRRLERQHADRDPDDRDDARVTRLPSIPSVLGQRAADRPRDASAAARFTSCSPSTLGMRVRRRRRPDGGRAQPRHRVRSPGVASVHARDRMSGDGADRGRGATVARSRGADGRLAILFNWLVETPPLLVTVRRRAAASPRSSCGTCVRSISSSVRSARCTTASSGGRARRVARRCRDARDRRAACAAVSASGAGSNAASIACEDRAPSGAAPPALVCTKPCSIDGRATTSSRRCPTASVCAWRRGIGH